jgi:hypothetical protein
MHDLQNLEAEKSVLRWGGLAGILGSVLFIVAFIFVAVVIGLDSREPAGWITKFPGIRAARIVENSLFVVVLILWVLHFVALYYALRRASLAPAVFGSILGIVGLVVLVAEALQHVAQAPLSDLYHAPGATPGDKATLVNMWQATQGILDSMFIAGLLLLPIGSIVLGMGMFRATAFGKGFGGMSVVVGVLGVAAASLLVVDPASELGGIGGVFTLIGFHFVLGWKVYTLSRLPSLKLS